MMNWLIFKNNNMRTDAYIRRRFFIGPVVLLALAIFSWATMALWNELMPELFKLPVINYWQALGLIVLTRLLMGTWRHHHDWPGSYRRNQIHEKISRMSPEEKKELFHKMHNKHRFWHEKHKSKNDIEPDERKSKDSE